jgi:hypothetical protein
MAAFYWTAPPRGSPAFWAFRAFRNYDGRGSAFGDSFLASASVDGASAFASMDASGTRAVVVAVNPNTSAMPAVFDVPARAREVRVYAYSGGNGFVETRPAADRRIAMQLAASSITTIEIRFSTDG